MENENPKEKKLEIHKINKVKDIKTINVNSFDMKMVELNIVGNLATVQRILQIFSRRAYKIESLNIKSDGTTKNVIIKFPADAYSYKIVVEQLKKLIDLIDIKHDKVADTNFEDKLIENLF